MPAESTFDIVSEFDRQEIVNAVDQTLREVRSRYDLKDTGTELDLGDKELTLTSDSEMTVNAVRDILQTRALRRNLSLKIFKAGPIQDIAGGRVRHDAVTEAAGGVADGDAVVDIVAERGIGAGGKASGEDRGVLLVGTALQLFDHARALFAGAFSEQVTELAGVGKAGGDGVVAVRMCFGHVVLLMGSKRERP